MATIVLSAAGASLGGSFGGSVLGLSGAAIGKAVGATVGRVIDQSLLGTGARAVETGKVDRFRLNGASEGAPVPEVWGRYRVPGQVIWASRFREEKTTTGGGKGSPSPKTTSYSYSVSLALALCEGEITRVGRVWADGKELALDEIGMRVYRGTEDQMPDPKMEAVEGAGRVPAYRGTAYVVLEDFQLEPFGNRVPQLTFEVVRGASATDPGSDLGTGVRAVAMVPGTGEYALATTPVHFNNGPGANTSANVNSPSGATDFETSLTALTEEAPNCGAVSLVVSWFGDDLNAAACRIRPKVEQTARDGVGMPWSVSGIARGAAGIVPELDGRPVYGGTPADASVIEAIAAMRDRGQAVMFYPFILMEQMEGNTLTDPHSGMPGQPALPWRGRITTSLAAGIAGSPDRSAAAAGEAAAFFGTAAPGDFQPGAAGVSYTGPEEFSYRRFILHYAHLCALAGGVEAFCIGSEMPGLTRIRSSETDFPAVEALRQLAADVRGILGPDVKIGYAADWSEYFGYHPQDGSGDVFFNLDPLWADPEIDFVGIDNYMPVSDWRDGDAHADAGWGAIYNLDYLKANIAGGEGYDWYYHAPEAEAIQLRSPITDGAYGEDWVFSYKDLRAWWSNPHHNRPGGVRAEAATAWVPRSKPIWFTEIGCAAIDKGTNQPNRFLDPKSSESGLPKYSSGARDDLIQMQFLRAVFDFWSDPATNPHSPLYDGPMVDQSRTFVWAWDTRPYPFFPGNRALWADGENYGRGHWLNGRIGARALAAVVEDICARSGVMEVETSGVYGALKGFTLSNGETARSALQPLMLAYGFDAVERNGTLVFETRNGRAAERIDEYRMVAGEDDAPTLTHVRAPEAEVSGRVRFTFVEADGDYEARAAEAIFPDEATTGISETEMALVLTGSEAQQTVERWLAEARIARDRVELSLPPSLLGLGAGDVIEIETDGVGRNWRIDRVEQAEYQKIEASRVEPGSYVPVDAADPDTAPRVFVPALPVEPLFLDLPLITGDEVPHAPHVAAAADPWPEEVAVYRSASGSDFALDTRLDLPAVVGTSESVLDPAVAGLFDRGSPLRVRFRRASLASVSGEALFAGANRAAIAAPGSDDWEVFQFAEATPVAPDLWDLSMRLRGQAGTDHLAETAWPLGSMVVLLGQGLRQVSLPSSLRGLAQVWRVGPARRAVSDASYVEMTRAFGGIGLRPYAPVHLRAAGDGAGGHRLTWIRRTRIDGDGWAGLDVPLGEASELYLVRILVDGAIRREATVAAPLFDYSAAMKADDTVPAAFEMQVAQVSDRFGPGPFRRILVND
ncbi:MAG: glycoside hydrolase TIM-barrel-like domain-containing protein [Paracoccaceae bacterium]|nr:glycoside hydrolase TIM-barrel-like domain-containing protein [Paracoccaceae bacterium]